jgi:single-stranded-DNA-specific exonuclease
MLAMPGPSRWTARPYSVAAAERLREELGVSQATAAILVRRGYGDPEAARRFLAADERHPADAFAGMANVCERILGHVGRGSRIVVHGDYDVDGVCSTAILIRALRALGVDPRWHLPSRFDGGYGLSRDTVERLASDGTDLLITADCAVTAVAEIERATALGVDVIVTDHHRPGERLPHCPILHPRLGGYPFPDLCAAGVTYKLAAALLEAAEADPALAERDLDLVALATICDVVPLRGENRRLAREGLRALARTAKPGLRALMRVAQVEAGRLTTHSVGFRLGPRLNAAGRLQRADAALELLLTEDEQRAAQIADELDLVNRERQDAETRILFAAQAAVAEQAGAAAYVLAGEGWHKGVIGIVAARMVERHHRPCVVIALEGDTGTGSGRSIGAFDLHAGLEACSGHLRRFGGHRAAAGLEIETALVPDFREAFADHAASVLSPDDLVPVEIVDAVVPGGALGLPLAEELEALAPFGQGNPSPVLLVPAARVADVRAMGDEAQHARFTLASGGARARAAAFRTAPRSLEGLDGEPHDAAVCLELGEWNGAVEPRVVLRSLCPTEPGDCAVLGEDERFFDALARELAGPASPAPPPGPDVRAVLDRRGEGIAGIAGDLLSSGERVLVVCAEVPRRRRSLEQLLGGLAARAGSASESGAPALAAISWRGLVARLALAATFEHLLALDPPASPAAEALLAAAPAPPGGGFAHRAWGLPEIDFALAVARAGLDLRDQLAELYRELRDSRPADPDDLESVLRARGGDFPRAPAECARLVRVLVELGLVAYDAAVPACRVVGAQRTSLEHSPAFVAARDELAQVERFLAQAAAELRDRRAPARATRMAGR